MEEKKNFKTRLFFINSYRNTLLQNHTILFEYNGQKLSDNNFKKTKLTETKQNFSVCLNELNVDDSWIQEENGQSNIKLYLDVIEIHDDGQKPMKYEININYTKNRANFIFGLKIGNLINKTSFYQNIEFDQCDIGFNYTFIQFYEYIIKKDLNNSADNIECLCQDTIYYLEQKKAERFSLFFEILLNLFIYSKEKKLDISILLELITKNTIQYEELLIFHKNEITDFIKEIFSNLEKDKNAWPFNLIHKYDNGEEFEEKEDEENEEDIKEEEKEDKENEEEIKEEEKEDKQENNNNSNKNKTEIIFMAFLLGYFSKNGTKEDYSLFFSNDLIKKKTIQTLNKINTIKKEIIISDNLRTELMKLCDGKNDIYGKLQIETNLLNYFEIMNEKFFDLSRLLKDFGLKKYKIEFQPIKSNDDIGKINPIHKQILTKENQINDFYLDFNFFIISAIQTFKVNNNLNQIIQIIEFVEDEKKENKNASKDVSNLEERLKMTMEEMIDSYDSNKKIVNDTFLLEIIPKMKNIFSKFSNDKKFQYLRKVKITSSDKNNLENVFKIIISNNLYEYFKANNNYDLFFFNVIKNVSGIEYLYYIIKVIPEKNYNLNIIGKIFDWLKNNIKSYSSELKINFQKVLSKFLELLINFKSSKINEFIELIPKSFSDALVIDFYIYFLENNKLDNNYKEKIINYFLDHTKNIFKTNDATIIPYIISKVKNDKNLLNLVLDKLKNKVIKEEEFFSNNITDNIKLLNDLKENNFFELNDIQIKDEYTLNTIKIIKQIKSNFENKNFSYEKASNILDNFINDNEILYKINLLFLSNDKSDSKDKAKILFVQFKNDVMKIRCEIQNLEDILKYFEEFFKNSKSMEIIQLKELIKSFRRSKLKDFDRLKEMPEYIEIIKQLNNATLYNKLKNSKCFMNYYNEEIFLNNNAQNQEEINEALLLQRALEKFNNLKTIFENDNFENVTENLKFLVELALNGEKNKFEEEISFLKNYFGLLIDEDKLNIIKSNIILFAQIKIINYILLALKELYNLFIEQIIKDENDKILEEIENFLKELSNENIEKKRIEEIIKFLKELNIYITNENYNEEEKNNNNEIKDSKEPKENSIIHQNIINRDLFLEFLKLVQNNPEAISFAKSNIDINTKILMDFFVESDDIKNLQEKDVQGFIKTVNFFDKIKREEFKFTEFIKKLNNILTVKNQEDYLGEYINCYIKNFNGIKIFYNEFLNKPEFSSSQISFILNESKITISINNMSIDYFDRQNKTIKNEGIEGLRGRALIMKSYMKKENNNKEKLIDENNNYNKVRIFVDLIQKFKIIKAYLNDLYNIGLPESENYTIYITIVRDSIKVNNSNKNDIYNYSDIDCLMCFNEIKNENDNREQNEIENKKELKFKMDDLIKYLYNLKQEIKDLTEKCYFNYEYIRFFYGNTLNFINKNLKLKNYDILLPLFNSLANNKITKIVSNFNYNYNSKLDISYNSNFYKEESYFDNNIIEEEIEENEKENEGSFDENNTDPIIYSFINMIYNISEYTKQVFQENGIKFCEEIYKINKLIESENNEKYDGVYLSNTPDKINDKKLIGVYKVLSNSYPTRATLLICSKETSKEEIISFLYRIFLYPYQSLFIINKSDSLTKENKIFLIEKVSEFLKLYKNSMKSLLIIFHSEEESEIKKGFNNNKDIKVFNQEVFTKIYKSDYINELKKLKKILVVKSGSCGEGKSNFIKSRIKNVKKEYIYFQIGGDFTKKNLFERIKKVKLIKGEEYIFHIDLTHTELNEMVKEFLFKFLVMKYYDYGSEIFSYNIEQVEIFIEIHNEIYNYLEKYPILNFCELKNIKLSTLIEEENNNNSQRKVEDSKIQIVAQIFKLLHEGNIGDNNIDLKSNNYLPLNPNDNTNFNSCQDLIDFYFKNNDTNDETIEIKNPNYYQKKMFINLLADQFILFTESLILKPLALKDNIREESDITKMDKAKNIRELIINSLINNTKLFVKGPYENLIKEQKETDFYLGSEEAENMNAINKLANKKLSTMVTYDNIKQNIIAFQDGKFGMLFKIITRNGCTKEELIKLNDLLISQSWNEGIPLLKNPKEKTEIELRNDLLDLCGIENEKEKENMCDEIKKNYPTYVFTTDNYIKMIHILMKTRANVPIIMMGETGCGKTSLIKMLSLIKSKGLNNRIKIINIHQGVNDEEIIKKIEEIKKETEKENEKLKLDEEKKFREQFEETENNKRLKKQKDKEILKEVKEKDEINEEEEEKKAKKTKEENINNIREEIDKKQMWIFFDELNTCNSMGLISEIFCNRTMRGKKIDDDKYQRYVFIGACNPYRILSEKSKKLEIGLKINNKRKKDLVYTVNPLPHSLLNYVIDFGELTEQDTKSYIESMIKNYINDDNNIEENSRLVKLAVNTVKLCHFFIKNNSDSSSVSLRDIKHFNIFYKGFIKYFEYLKDLSRKQNIGIITKNPHLNEFSEINSYTIKKNSINLSIYISYYLRLPTKSLREELCKLLDEQNYFEYGFLHVPLKESKFILDQIYINPQRGIAKNNALRENIFCELFCLINKIPLIICGKPGNSKSLSVQLLLDNMKGKLSLNEFFKNPDYKEVISYPFQGSTTCTSNGIKKAFEKARHFAEKNNDMISLVFFDEMGLAEESSENPLKVLHSELDNEEIKVAFFGITNWALDASKMNRGIRIFSQDPELQDLIDTSSEIAKSIDEKIFKDNEELFKILSETYNDFREAESKTGFKDFHGNRDFYNLIRNTMKYLKEESEKNEEKDLVYIRTISAIKALERNFGGYQDSVDNIVKIFYRKSKYNNIDHKYNIIKSISDNFRDINSRYLLLISKNSTSQSLIEQIIHKEKKQSVIYIGSQFKGDKSESYIEEMLYKIQIQMENEVILVMKGLEIIYPSLYDLFNQNFSESNGNKYAKISFSNNQSTSLVNNKFKIVVLIDENMILYEDKPFLNRFEKHVISLKNFLPKQYIQLVNTINKKIEDLINYESVDGKKKIQINLKKQLISCDSEVIENLVFKLTNNKENISDDEIISKIFELISPTLSQDIISCIHINGFKEREKELSKILETSYSKNHSSNINDYLNKISKTDLRHIIYTFSNITEPIKEIMDNSIFNKKNIKEIVIDTIGTSKELELLIDSFYKENQNLCIIKFEEEDLNKMNYVKNIIDNIEKVESIKNNKYYLFIVYLKREFINDNKTKENKITLNKNDLIIKDQIPLMDDFNQIIIDNLNNENNKFNIFELISKNNKSIIEIFLDINELINQNIYDCFDKFNIKFKNKKKEFNSNQYKKKLSEGIINSEYLMNILKELLIKNCKNINEIILDILTDSNVFHNDNVELSSLFKIEFKKQLILKLTETIYIFEKNQILSSYLIYYKEIYQKIIDSFSENIDYNTISTKTPITKILGLQLPMSSKSLGNMNTFIKNNIIEKYTNNENKLRTDLSENENERTEIEKYEKQKQELENQTKNQINKIRELEDILRTNDISIIKAFFNDLSIYFFINKDDNSEIPESKIKFLDIIIQIYFLDSNLLKTEADFSTNFAEKITEKYKANISSNEFDDYLIDIAKLLLFLQSYSEFIRYLIEIYFEIYKFYPQVEEVFIKSFINGNFEYEKSDRCLEYFAIVNLKLYKIFESLIFTMKKVLYFLCDKQKEKIEDYLIFIRSHIADLKQFNSDFSFYSKEYYTLNNLILVMKSLENNNKKLHNDDLIKISKLLDDERSYINSNNQKKLIENLEEMKEILIKNLDENSDEYSSLFISILLNEYKIFSNEEHRLNIIRIICGNNNLIKKSIPILEIIFSDVEPSEINEKNIDNNEDINEEYDQINLVQIFMKQEDEEINKKYELIDEEINNTFSHILLYFFECKIEQFFFKINKNNSNTKEDDYLEKMFDSSAFISFKKALLTYIKIQNNEINNDNAYINLLKLYSIAYIKRYITHYIDLKLESEYSSDRLKNDRELNFDNNDENQPNEIKLVKIYMLKLIHQKGKDVSNKEYLQERYLNFLQGFIDNYQEDNQGENAQKHKDDCIFNLNEDHLDFRVDKQINDVKNGKQQINNMLDNFYSLVSNQYISEYLKKNNEFEIDEDIKSIYKHIKESEFNITPEIKTFYDNILSAGFYKQLKSKLPKNYEYKDERINIILFILKVILLSINNEKKNIFSSLLNKEKAHKIIKESFLPGMTLAKKSIYTEELKDIDNHLKSRGVREGAYVCSCGKFYTIDPCGFPTRISECFNCKEKIGGENHILIRREGHMRIFLNDEARKSQLSIYYADKEIPNMLLDEYKIYAENKEKNNEKEQNLNLMNKDEFMMLNLDLSNRKIDNLSFRVLNFILYSHLFFANIIGILTDEEVKRFQIEELSIFEIIEKDYEIINILIKEINHIKDIKEFMNILYYVLEKSIESEEIFETKEKRGEFEKKINNAIDSSILNSDSNIFKKLKNNYKENIKNLKLNKKSLKKIINQEYSPDEEDYKSHAYLKELKFFMISNCPNIEMFKDSFKNINDRMMKYPVINKILNSYEDIELLQIIPNLNEVSNSFRQYYSYNIERKVAKEKSVESEKEKIINNIFNGDEKKFDESMKNYQNCWNKIKEKVIKFGCRDEMIVHEIKNYLDEKIAFFLVDKGELNYGMYLSAAYDYLIMIQNSFANSIINYTKDNKYDSIHKNYIKQLEKTINIQEADKKDIPKPITIEKLNEIINFHSIRKCFTSDGIVVYNNYEGIEINFDKIEESLCEIVLPQVKQFKPDIFFVTYRFEGYRGKNSEILTKYIEKYNPQRKLNQKELSTIFNYIENNKNIKLIEFLFDLQKLINYIQEENYKNEKSIKDIISQIPSIIHLEKIKQFINNNSGEEDDNKKLFTVNSLIDFYNLFEHLCWDEIKSNINNEFKKSLNDIQKQEIKQYFNNLNPNCIIKKLNLSTALRRFISKYLSGLSNDTDISEDKPLMTQLKRPDLWDYSFVAHPYFDKEIDKIDTQLKINIGYAMDLYDVLGGDEILKTNYRNTVKIEIKNENGVIQSQKIKTKEKNSNVGGQNQNRGSIAKKKVKKREKA